MGEKANVAEYSAADAVGHQTVAGSGPGQQPTATADTDKKGKSGAKWRQPFSGEVDLGDGYTMGRDESGQLWLQGKDGLNAAHWSERQKAWIDMGSGKPMPKGWGGGHQPGEGLPAKAKK